MAMPQEIVQIDAFTSEPFRGNPAAVCLMDEPASEAGVYPKSYFVVVENDDIVRKLVPDLAAIEKLPEPKVCVTAPDTTGQADFVSRLFAPALGINEDPVNGNSHTALTP